MSNTWYIVQLIIAILVSVLVFMQSKGSGLSKSISSAVYHSRRGLEKVLFRLTILLVVVFIIVSLGTQFVS